MKDEHTKEHAEYLAARTNNSWTSEEAERITQALLALPMRIKCHHCGAYAFGLKHELVNCNECKKALWE